MRLASQERIVEGTGDWHGEESPTLAASAHELLRRGILACHYAPGARLRLDALRRELGFGFSPIREALSRLTGEGLVEQEGQRGFRVAPVSMEDLEDITLIRSEVELMALRQSIARGGDAWETGVAAAAHHLALISAEGARPSSAESNEWARRHAAFHESLVAACGSPRLLAIRKELYELSERYRRLLYAHGIGPRDVAEEHKAIAAAVIDRDADTACELMRAHMRATADTLVKLLAAKSLLQIFS